MIKYDNLYYNLYNPYMDYTFIKKSDNMQLIELNRIIEETKANYELAKSEEEYYYYESILNDLINEKQEMLNNEFKRRV